MHINGPANIHGPQPISAPHRTAPAQQPTPTHSPQGVDQVDISHEADALIQSREIAHTMAQEIQQSRAERVAQIKAEIEAGTYETDDKLELAVGRLFNELG